MQDRIEKQCTVGISPDIKILDYVPPIFKAKVLSEGRVIVERIPYMALLLKWSSLQELNNIEAKRRKILSLGRIQQ